MFLEEDEDENFTNADIWSQLTYRWLNPIFRKGRVQKLELGHIPDVPHSKTAENASSILEESLRKQKLEEGSLTKAIASSVWKSLALNAVFSDIGITKPKIDHGTLVLRELEFKIGDFYLYIHGVWLLPVQVILALVILCINLGFLPSISTLAVTILVMVMKRWKNSGVRKV
ncbi:hypothetical protein PIB30_007441 [Stylosanthes scabra]|uniref:Uncharacterized protein n=1 Tax=Stylosanthes scabra TaxID=79078 RepID=A0ABU6R3H4_9FABA|nr:hypothetical protein [Stylosanthes scabra]